MTHTNKPPQLAASAFEAYGQEARLAYDRGFSKLPYDAFEPDEQRWRPAGGNARQHGPRHR